MRLHRPVLALGHPGWTRVAVWPARYRQPQLVNVFSMLDHAADMGCMLRCLRADVPQNRRLNMRAGRRHHYRVRAPRECLAFSLLRAW